MSEREERRFVEIPRESVRLMAESTGLELSDEVAALLAEDVCYRLREATQVRSPSLPACSRLSPPRGRPLPQGHSTQVWVRPLLGLRGLRGLRGKATEEAVPALSRVTFEPAGLPGQQCWLGMVSRAHLLDSHAGQAIQGHVHILHVRNWVLEREHYIKDCLHKTSAGVHTFWPPFQGPFCLPTLSLLWGDSVPPSLCPLTLFLPSQNSSQFMKHTKRRKLTVEDFNRALRWSSVEVS